MTRQKPRKHVFLTLLILLVFATGCAVDRHAKQPFQQSAGSYTHRPVTDMHKPSSSPQPPILISQDSMGQPVPSLPVSFYDPRTSNMRHLASGSSNGIGQIFLPPTIDPNKYPQVLVVSDSTDLVGHTTTPTRVANTRHFLVQKPLVIRANPDHRSFVRKRIDAVFDVWKTIPTTAPQPTTGAQVLTGKPWPVTFSPPSKRRR